VSTVSRSWAVVNWAAFFHSSVEQVEKNMYAMPCPVIC
jgi:hypothetical protein